MKTYPWLFLRLVPMGTCCQDILDCDWFISPFVLQTEHAKDYTIVEGQQGLFPGFFGEKNGFFFWGGGGGRCPDLFDLTLCKWQSTNFTCLPGILSSTRHTQSLICPTPQSTLRTFFSSDWVQQFAAHFCSPSLLTCSFKYQELVCDKDRVGKEPGRRVNRLELNQGKGGRREGEGGGGWGVVFNPISLDRGIPSRLSNCDWFLKKLRYYVSWEWKWMFGFITTYDKVIWPP